MTKVSDLPMSDGVRLRVRVSGPTDAPVTVVFLHGWTLDGRTWHRQVTALENFHTARVVTYDARGHGRSDTTPLRSATLAQLGDDLAEVLGEVVPTGPVILVGHSLGGMTIMEYAHRHPDDFAARVAGTAFVATSAEGDTHTAYGLPSALTTLLRTAETAGAQVLARCGEWHPHRAFQLALRPSLRWLLFGHPCDPADVRLTAQAVAYTSLCSIGGFRPSVGTQRRLDTLATLPPVPSVVLVGDRDRLTPPTCAHSIVAALPSARLTILPGAGHMVMLERPDEVTSALVDLVGRAGEREEITATTP